MIFIPSRATFIKFYLVRESILWAFSEVYVMMNQGNIDKVKEPIQELTGKFPTTEVLDEVFNFNICPLNKRVNPSTRSNFVPANFTDATYSNEAKNSNETKEFEKSIVPNQHLRNDHELEGKSPHGCPKCGKLFKFQGALKNHIKRVHWKEI